MFWRRTKLLRVRNDMGVSEKWQHFHFGVAYRFNWLLFTKSKNKIILCVHLFYNMKRKQSNGPTAIINHDSFNALKDPIRRAYSSKQSDKLSSTCGVWSSAVIYDLHTVLWRDMTLCTFFGNLPELEGHSEGLSHRECDCLGLREQQDKSESVRQEGGGL